MLCSICLSEVKFFKHEYSCILCWLHFFGGGEQNMRLELLKVGINSIWKKFDKMFTLKPNEKLA